MGNSQTKESRGPASPTTQSSRHGEGSIQQSGGSAPVYSSRSGRGSRHDLSFLGLGGNSTAEREQPEVRRETKQEREARKLEKERVAREKERERSMRDEHVDGGYLVTQGVYTGTEDFSKVVVRQLMIERRIAPFWKGLNDFKEDWTEHQLVAAVRDLPIPAADDIPPEDVDRPTVDSPRTSSNNLQHLTVPIAGRSASYASDTSANLSPSHPAFSLPSPTSPLASPSSMQPGTSSVFRPRSKTLASLTTSLKNPPQEQIVPQEIQLPNDPYVNGQKIEAFLYKDATECPICFIYYPPHLNKTRCCDQPICSECFVQIKRPDPHPPEHADPSQPAPAVPRPEDAETLVSEPATCPYCQQEEFGVTYEPPPFRRGLSYANMGAGSLLGSATSAMSSSSSLNSMGSPGLQPAIPARRRTTSISANASTVISTDRIRPDWATKLASARSHAARRSAAATALHLAAYTMGNGSDSRGFGFSSRSRFGRSRDSPGGSGAETPAGGAERDARIQQLQSALAEARSRDPPSGSRPRRSRMDELEDMMMMEAIRLSLAAEEERKKKEEKAAAKEAKKKEKADKKEAKKAQKGMYSAGGSSASGSALSLSLPGVGRRRGNSGSSAFLREATMNNSNNANSTDKGKSVERGSASPSPSQGSSPITIGGQSAMSQVMPSSSSRHNLDSGLAAIPAHDSLSPGATAPEKPSHLRQMSNASSPASSFVESVPNSLRNTNGFHNSNSSLDSPNASGTHLAGNSYQDDGGSGTGTPSLEPMFNFRSLAEMIDREEANEKSRDAEHVEHSENGNPRGYGHQRGESSASVYQTSDEPLAQSKSTLRADNGIDEDIYGSEDKAPGQFDRLNVQNTPELMITPVTPAPGDHDGKQLGAGINFEVEHGKTATK